MKTQPDQAWSDAADAMLTELRGRGLGNSEIAREMGRGKASIAHRCAKLIAAGKLPRRQSWRAWTTAEIRQAERLLRDGLSWKEVARRLDRTQDALYKIAEQKMSDLNANDVDAAAKIIAGTARSMGITTEA